MLRPVLPLLLPAVFLLGAGCEPASPPDADAPSAPERPAGPYATVRLDADVSGLSDAQAEMVRLFVEAAQAMDGIFWEQAYGNRDSLLQAVADPARRRLVRINYGPWDRYADHAPFVEGVGPKPPGANFYPESMTRAAFEQAARTDGALDDRHTMVRRLPDGSLGALPYHQFFMTALETAAGRLREASALTDDAGLRRYLERRAEALTTGDYRPSTRAWMEVTASDLDLVVGPIGTDEDRLFGYKEAVGALVLRRDRAWDRRLDRYAERLPALRAGLPGPEQNRAASPGRLSGLGVFDLLYASGAANAGPKPLALTLPADPDARRETGGRHLRLRNATRGTFDALLRPLTDVLVAEEQRPSVTFDAYFGNAMRRAVARRLGGTETGGPPGSDARRPHRATMAAARAGVLGLYVAQALAEDGSLDEGLAAVYTTDLARLLHTVRADSARARGRAALLRLTYFRERGAVLRDAATGTYAVVPDSVAAATDALARRLLTLQDGDDAEAIAAFVDTYGTVPAPLRADLDRLTAAKVPVGVAYEQGPAVLTGLAPPTAER